MEASTKVTRKLNCLFSRCGEGEGHVPLKQPYVHGLSPPEVPDLFTVARLHETGRLVVELSPNVHLFLFLATLPLLHNSCYLTS